MSILVIATMVWLLIHIGIAGTRARDALAARTGEGPFRGLFSLLAILSMALLIWAWSGTDTTPWWYPPEWLRWLLAAVMLPAFILFVASLIATDGIHRVTRHPMLWSFALWAAVHIIANGDSAATVFFGTFLVTPLVGMPSIDAKLARRDPAAWRSASAATSIIPFVAIAQGRNRFVPGEIGWLTLLIAVVAWGATLYLHPWLFGVAPVAL